MLRKHMPLCYMVPLIYRGERGRNIDWEEEQEQKNRGQVTLTEQAFAIS